MDIVQNLATGFAAAASWSNLGFALIGCLLGTLIGVLPGIGPIPTIAMLLPITFGLDPLAALIMLAGIYYGAQYGGSTTSILVNMPGEASSIVTCIDGYQMARQGRAGAALVVAALGSFFAGCVGTLSVAAFAPPLAYLAQQFNSPDYFSLMVLGLMMAIVLAHGSVLKALAMVLIGLLLGLVGTDVSTGVTRYTFGWSAIWDRIDFLPLVIGMFGIAEIMRNVERPDAQRNAYSAKMRELWPKLSDLRAAWPSVMRGTGVGALLGILPGGGAVLAAFASYTLEKKIAKDPSRFGQGAIEGVAGPGIGEQRRRPDLVHPAAHPRPAFERGDGADDGRDDHSRHRAGLGGDGQTARPVLGHGRLDVDRQRHAADHQPAAARHLGEAALGALPAALSRGALVLRDRRLQHQHRGGAACPHGDLRGVRLSAGAVRLRAGAAGAGLHPRPADGGEPAALARDVARRSG